MNIMVWKQEANGEDYGISLIQTGQDTFTVVYGLQRDKGLRYADAAAKLGQAIMHQAACKGAMSI